MPVNICNSLCLCFYVRKPMCISVRLPGATYDRPTFSKRAILRPIGSDVEPRSQIVPTLRPFEQSVLYRPQPTIDVFGGSNMQRLFITLAAGLRFTVSHWKTSGSNTQQL